MSKKTRRKLEYAKRLQKVIQRRDYMLGVCELYNLEKQATAHIVAAHLGESQYKFLIDAYKQGELTHHDTSNEDPDDRTSGATDPGSNSAEPRETKADL